MRNYVVDTHGLVWYFNEDERLGKEADKILQRGERGKLKMYVPTIVLVEADGLAKKVGQSNQFRLLVKKLLIHSSFIIYPFNKAVLQEYFSISDDLEIHDRLIVATAKLTKSTVITKDRKIILSKIVKTIW